MNNDKIFYPNANSTMRLTYGSVESYKGDDAVLYNYYTTHKGILEKENIDYYNDKYKTKIPYIDFRRNIVTEGIELNALIQKEIKIKFKL